MDDVSILHTRQDHLRPGTEMLLKKTLWGQHKGTTETHQTAWGQIGVQALCTPWSYQQPHPWTVAIKLLIKFSTNRTHSFQGRTLLCTPLPGKAIKLFFSISHPLKKSLWQANRSVHFSNRICSLCVSVSHFGSSSNISNSSIAIFVMVIWDQWSMIFLL